jgi:protein-tyrosine phosphatase
MGPALHVIDWRGPGRLATMAHPRGGAQLSQEMAGLAAAGVDVLVSALTWEEEQRLGLTEVAPAAAGAGIEFFSFPIADRGLPEAGAVADPLASRETNVVALGVRLAAHVRAGRFVVTQCFAGIGRSTLLAGATLVMLGIGPQRALHLVAEARGRPVPDTDAQRHWLYEFAAVHGG